MNNTGKQYGFSKGQIGLCTETHGNDKTSTSNTCQLCKKRVCHAHQLEHVTAHLAAFHSALTKVFEGGDAASKAVAAEALSPAKKG